MVNVARVIAWAGETESQLPPEVVFATAWKFSTDPSLDVMKTSVVQLVTVTGAKTEHVLRV